jgi:ParB-like chromosome segregation protein Spo0J
VGAEYVETRDIPIRDLTRFPGNAQRGDVDAIQQSIRIHGQYRALVVREQPDGKLVILAGNHTYLAVKAEGHATVRCEVVRCDDTTATKINIGDNRYAQLGEIDHDALLELLSSLDGDYDGTGFSEQDVHDMLTPSDDFAITDGEPARYGATIPCATEEDQDDLIARLVASGFDPTPIYTPL